jgi:hypothetical protein
MPHASDIPAAASLPPGAGGFCALGESAPTDRRRTVRRTATKTPANLGKTAWNAYILDISARAIRVFSARFLSA